MEESNLNGVRSLIVRDMFTSSLKEKGINIHDKQYLKDVPKKIHHLITDDQDKWWKFKAEELGNKVNVVHAFKHESSGKYFTVKMEAYGDLKSGKVHVFIKITSLETKKEIYVDDGFFNKSFVHDSKPIGGIYKDEFDLVEELAREKCNVPKIRDHLNNQVP